MKDFRELGINERVISAIEKMGFKSPMPIQKKAIPMLLQNDNDIIGLAQTGTGKTAAFGIPIVQNINIDIKQPQALVLAPTRELCLQISKDLKNYSMYMKEIKILSVYGGSNIGNQIRELKRGVHIIVATPGRLNDLLNRGVIKVDNINIVVLDEADEMLRMGFKDDLDAILGFLPENKKTLLFSATMPGEIVQISKNYMKDAIKISVGKANIGADNIEHRYYLVRSENRYTALKRIIDYHSEMYGIIFCQTRKDTKEVAHKLIKDGYNAEAIHGELSQAQRENIMNRFRLKSLQFLVATDVAARGIDVKDITHVINYSLPENNDVYIHRSGRTGRAGKSGVSIAIVNLREQYKIKVLEKKLNKKFKKELVPDGLQICEKQLVNFFDSLQNTSVENDIIDKFFPIIEKKLEGYTKEELIKLLISNKFKNLFEYYKNAKDINVKKTERVRRVNDKNSFKKNGSKNKRNSRKPEPGYIRLFINLGHNDNLTPGNLISLINKYTPGKYINVGRINLFDKFSFFEIQKEQANILLDSLKNVEFNDRKVAIDIAKN